MCSFWPSARTGCHRWHETNHKPLVCLQIDPPTAFMVTFQVQRHICKLKFPWGSAWKCLLCVKSCKIHGIYVSEEFSMWSSSCLLLQLRHKTGSEEPGRLSGTSSAFDVSSSWAWQETGYRGQESAVPSWQLRGRRWDVRLYSKRTTSARSRDNRRNHSCCCFWDCLDFLKIITRLLTSWFRVKCLRNLSRGMKNFI